LVGVDTASAGRMVWLARMAAARDIALGLGVVATAVSRRARVPALAVTALVDVTDAVAVAMAAREHRLDPVRGYAVAAGAAVGALAGFAAAADLLRRPG